MPKQQTDDDILAQLKENLKIDEHELDENFVEQPTLFYHVASAHQEASAALDRIKSEMEQAEAEMYVQYTKKAVEAEEKWTDTSIKRDIVNSQRMRKLEARWLDLKAKVGKLAVMKEAYSQRGYALNKLADLYAANYFTTESGGKRRSELAEDMAERNKKEISKLRKERRK